MLDWAFQCPVHCPIKHSLLFNVSGLPINVKFTLIFFSVAFSKFLSESKNFTT